MGLGFGSGKSLRGEDGGGRGFNVEGGVGGYPLGEVGNIRHAKSASRFSR